MNYPSIDKIQEGLEVDRDMARTIRGIIEGKINPLDFESCAHYASQCISYPSILILKLYALNEVFGGYGVEFERGIEFINAGDVYNTTILYISGHWKFGCLGDYLK